MKLDKEYFFGELKELDIGIDMTAYATGEPIGGGPPSGNPDDDVPCSAMCEVIYQDCSSTSACGSG